MLLHSRSRLSLEVAWLCRWNLEVFLEAQLATDTNFASIGGDNHLFLFVLCARLPWCGECVVVEMIREEMIKFNYNTAPVIITRYGYFSCSSKGRTTSQ